MHDISTWGEPDLPSVAGQLNGWSTFDRFPLDQLREALLEDADHHPDLLLRVEGHAVAAGVVRGENGFVKLLAVAPDRRRQGVGSALLAELERRLAERGAKSVRMFADAPHYLRPGVDYRDTPFISFLERRGYEVQRPAANMSVDLAEAPLDTSAEEARLAAEGFEVRRLRAEDADAFGAYMLEKWSPNWRAEATRSLSRSPVSTHLCLRDGRIVGFASHSVSGPGQFGPMGTNGELRGRGVGAVLLKRCLADQKAAGLPECDIQWVGPKGFYADHVGARMSRCFWQFQKSLS